MWSEDYFGLNCCVQKNKEWVIPCLIPQERDSLHQETCGVNLLRKEILTSWIPYKESYSLEFVGSLTDPCYSSV
jgi:hypothetical protein